MARGREWYLWAFSACWLWAGACTSVREDAVDVRVVRAAQREVAPLALTASDGTGLALSGLTAKVVLQPPLVFTELELAFHNPEPRRREGRFEITLPEAASISRLALQMGDRFQEGEIVERHRAQLAYEEALHGRRDPALLEREAGNRYGVRVFPIEAHEVKRVIVAYSQRIADDDAYRLHLAGLPEIDRLRLEVSRAGVEAKPRVLARRAWRPTGDVEISMPASSGSTALVHGDLALLQVRPAMQSSATALTRLTVLFDTSASHAGDFEAQIERMQLILRELGKQRGAAIPVQLVVFDQEAVPLIESSSDAFGEDLKAQLLERGALGATDLEGALRTLATLPQLGDRLLVFSDGLVSAGATAADAIARSARALGERGVQRIDAVTHGEVLDRALLRALVHAELPEAGVIAPDHDAVAAARRLLRGTERRVEVEIEGAQWTFPSVLAGVEAGVAYPVFAKLGAPGTVRLSVGARSVPLTTVTASAATLLEQEWARARIEALQARMAMLSSSDAQSARAQIVELSKKHRVLSEHTALVVLENDRDYARNGIARSALSDVTVVRDGALAQATDPQAAPGALAEDFPRDARDMGSFGHWNADAALGLGSLGTTDGSSFGTASYGRGRGSQHAMPSVRSGKLDVRGALSREVVRRILSRHINEARFCYEQRLHARPRLAGEMAVRFVIGPSGSVQAPQVLSATLNDEHVKRCIVTALRRWFFPAPEGGGIVSVTHSLHFSLGDDPAAVPLTAEDELQAQRAKAREEAARAAHTRREREREWQQRARPTPASYLEGEMLEALSLLEVGDTAGAFARARAWQRGAQHDVMALIALARAAEGIGDLALAARAYGSLIDLFPSRPDLRRAAGQGLEGLGAAALDLAIDSYRKAVELRPDHPSSHRLLGMALWRSGEVELAHAVFARADRMPFPGPRFPGVQPLLAEEKALTWRPFNPPQEMVRVCVYWETDATNLDLHVYDGEHRHATSDRGLMLDNGARLHSDVATGYGPECFTATGSEITYPYLLQAHYRSRGAMGHALGALHVLRIDAHGKPSFESRPFVVMHDNAFVPLGELTRDGDAS